MASVFWGAGRGWVNAKSAESANRMLSAGTIPAIIHQRLLQALVEESQAGAAVDVAEGVFPDQPDDMNPAVFGVQVNTDTNGGSALAGSLSEPGADLRDFDSGMGRVGILDQGPGGGSFSPGPAGVPGIIALTRLLPMLPVFAFRLQGLARGAAQGTILRWNALPAWAQTALQGVGLVGTSIAVDQIFFGDDGGGGMTDLAIPGVTMTDGSIGVQVVGSWVANGVTFYRLADGRLAVQNKRGRWKVWRPKKPIVLMPTGATDLRTLLRADAVLNRQAKKIASMLARRAPRSKAKSPATTGKTIVVAQDGSKVSQY